MPSSAMPYARPSAATAARSPRCAPMTWPRIPLAALLQRNPSLDPAAIEEVLLGCANQAGEDNRNVARMAALLAGLPVRSPARHQPPVRLGPRCRRPAARAVRSGEAEVLVAGGVESMSRAPFVMPKADAAFSRNAEVLRHDDRLAVRQSAHEGALRHRLDAGDRRERGRAIQHHARGPGPLRAAQPAAHRRRRGARLLQRRAGRSGDPATQGQAAAAS